jgi:phage baseplate assembly protein gpV
MDPWTENDIGEECADGTTWRYHQSTGAGDDAVLSVAFFDGTHFKYDVTNSLMQWFFRDGAIIKYDAVAHAYSISLPDGATFQVTLNGATISVDADGKISLQAATDIALVTDEHDTSINQVIDIFNSHDNMNVQSGSDNTGPPSVTIP